MLTKNTPLLILALLCASMSLFSQTSDLILSEYGEGSGNNKFIEIYNGTGASVDLSDYQVWLVTNGGTWPESTINLSGTLTDSNTYVFANSSSSAAILAIADATSGSLSWNGNDAVGLAKDNGSGTFLLIDAVGTDGANPGGGGWSVAGVAGSTTNNTLVRKATVCDPNTNWTTSAGTNSTDSEWSILPSDDISSLGSHTSSCVSACTPTHTITSFAPASGPEFTHVTITGTGYSGTTTVNFNGVAATVLSQTTTQLVVEAPSAFTTGKITVTESSCDLDSATDFTLISGTCSGSGGLPTGFTDLMFSGIYDDQTDSCHYFELLNPTGSDIDLSDYTIGLDNNFTLGSGVPTTGFSGGILALSGTILAESTTMIRLSAAGTCTSCPSVVPDLSFINGGINVDDRLVLVKDYGTGTVAATDVWQNHSTPGTGYNVGYVFTRANTATAPSTTFNLADWDNDGDEDCFGFAITLTPAPSIDTQPLDVNDCDIASVNISVSAGASGTLSYTWKYNDGSATGWADVTSAAFSPGTVTGETSTDLSITGFNLDGYQFYCEVVEAGVCTVTTNAIQIAMANSIWDGSVWSNGAPDINTMAVINGAYDTATNGSFTACSLIVNKNIGAGLEYRLNVANNTFVEIDKNATVDGELYVQPQGAFIQNNDSAGFTLTTDGTALVNKTTTTLSTAFEYTYWSSPVEDALVQNGLAFANPSRRFWFNAPNFLDILDEIDNTNTFVSGSDGIDDNGDDWVFASGTDVMTPGVGFIAMHSTVGFTAGSQYTYTFEGAFNNGVINTPIAYNGANGDEDWNLIGNPYPSAVDANAFLTANNTVVGGAIYLWAHATDANGTTSGNDGANFSQDDYAMITSGSGNIAGGDMVIPNDYIPSGQSFFIQGLATGNATFNNSMRMADATSNSQFFRTDSSTPNKLWINLTSDNGVFSQLLVAYVNGATNGKDNLSFDARRSIYTENVSAIYTEIENDSDKYAIQGKAPESLTLSEIIPVGFQTGITVPTIYTLSIAQLQGDFFAANTVYLKDNLLNTVHDLSASDYSFTSIAGNFNDRFEIVFNVSTLSVDEFSISDDSVSIIELENDNVKFTVSNNVKIESVKIFDALGKLLYNLKGNNSTEVFSLSNLSQAPYIAQIQLSNGQTISKKAIKK